MLVCETATLVGRKKTEENNLFDMKGSQINEDVDNIIESIDSLTIHNKKPFFSRRV